MRTYSLVVGLLSVLSASPFVACGNASTSGATDAGAQIASDASSDEGEGEADSGQSLDASHVRSPDAVADGPPQGQDAGASGGCSPDEKVCGGHCVSANDPTFGCSGTSCMPCSIPHATPACSAGACAIGACAPGYADCDDNAANGCEVEVTSDPGNCGACGHACAAGSVCDQGTCASSCGGLTACGASCVDTSSDPQHCGGCANVCSAPTNGVATCANGQCSVACNSGFDLCSGACTADDPSECGPSCTACPGASDATPTCSNGVCGLSCNAGFHSCAGSCVAESPASCGPSCQSCPVPYGATATCSGGTCGLQCNVGFAPCAQGCCASSVACGNMAGLQAGSPWPMFQACPTLAGRTTVVGPQSPKLAWTFTASTYQTTTPVIAADGTIYFATWGSGVFAVGSDGTQKWNVLSDVGTESGAPAIGADGTVYVALPATPSLVTALPNELYALDPSTGATRWSIAADGTGNFGSDVAIGPDGTAYEAESDGNNGGLLAISPTGTKKWSAGTYPNLTVLLGLNGTLYGDGPSAFTAGGAVLFERSTLLDPVFGPAMRSDGLLVALTETANPSAHLGIVLFDPSSQTQSWESPLDGTSAYTVALGADGSIYVGDDTAFYAYRADGTRAWKYSVNGGCEGPPAVGGDGTIYTACATGVYAFRPDGSVLWTYPPVGGYSGAVAIGADGTLYVSNGHLYAFAP